MKGLDLQSRDSASFRTETMTGGKVISADLINFELQLLISDETFSLSNVVAHKPWQNDVGALPHRQNVNSYSNFQNIDLLHLPKNDSVDTLIGNDNAFLITLFVEREGDNVKNPLFCQKLVGISRLEKGTVKICQFVEHRHVLIMFRVPVVAQLLLLVITKYENFKRL